MWCALSSEQALLSNTKLGTNPTKWLASFEDIWHLVLPKAPVDRILALGEKEPWDAVRVDIMEVTGSGMLGKKLFGFALRAIAESRVATIISEAASQIWDMEIINHQTLGSLTRETEAKLEEVSESNCLDGARAVTVEYRGFDVEMEVKDVPQHVFYSFQAVVRGYASECGDLEMIMAESQLCKNSGRARKGVMDAKLLVDAKHCRSYANRVLAASGAKDGKSMMDLLR